MYSDRGIRRIRNAFIISILFLTLLRQDHCFLPFCFVAVLGVGGTTPVHLYIHCIDCQ